MAKLNPMADTESVLRKYHTAATGLSSASNHNQCGSSLVQIVKAPLRSVWAVVRRFDRPQAYKKLVKSCILRHGNGGVGSVREVTLVSGLPANSSTERLDVLDDEAHVMTFSIIGGDHRLENYRSTTTVHEEEGRAVVVESYVVDIPEGSSREDTLLFADTIVKCNLKWLATLAESSF